jgi:integrase
LNAEALAAFQELYQRTGGEGPIFLSNHGERLVGPRHWFEDAVQEAGIQRFTWHDARHTFASRLVMAGVDLRTVADLMGHKHIQMTMRYSHLAPAHTRAAVERLTLFISSKKSNSQEEESAKLVAAPEGATDTRTDTDQNQASPVAFPAVQ